MLARIFRPGFLNKMILDNLTLSCDELANCVIIYSY